MNRQFSIPKAAKQLPAVLGIDSDQQQTAIRQRLREHGVVQHQLFLAAERRYAEHALGPSNQRS